MNKRLGRPVSISFGNRLTQLAVGGVLIAVGIAAFSWTLRRAPWNFWLSIWPIMILAAGAALVFYGNRQMLVVGLVLLGLGGIFFIGMVGSLVWLAMSVFWPLILLLVGIAIVGAGLSRSP